MTEPLPAASAYIRTLQTEAEAAEAKAQRVRQTIERCWSMAPDTLPPPAMMSWLIEAPPTLITNAPADSSRRTTVPSPLDYRTVLGPGALGCPGSVPGGRGARPPVCSVKILFSASPRKLNLFLFYFVFVLITEVLTTKTQQG